MRTQAGSEKKGAGRAGSQPRRLNPVGVPVRAVMSRRVTTVRPDTSLDAAMDMMMMTDIGHLPVVDERGALVGIVSKTDVVRRLFMDGDTVAVEQPVRVSARHGVSASLGAGFHEDSVGPRTVAEVMSTRVRTVPESASVAEAASFMAKHRVHGLPVVADGHVLVGFVSTFDIVGWVATT